MRRHLAALAAALLAMLVAPRPCAADDSDEVRWVGPFHVRSQFPLDLTTLDLTPDTARILEPGVISLEVMAVHSNTFEITPGYDARVTLFDAGGRAAGYDFNMDAETTRTTIRFDAAVARRVELGFELPIVTYSAGFLDSLVDRTHTAFGLPGNDRGLKPDDVLNVDILSATGRDLLDGEGTHLGDIVLRAKWGLLERSRSALAAVIEVKAPTGDERSFSGSGSWDEGLAFLVSAGSVRHSFHGGAGYQALGQPDRYPVAIRDRTDAYAGYAYSPNARWSLAAHVMAASSILPAGPHIKSDDPRAELVAGVRYGRRDWDLSAGFIENLTTSDNTADFGIFFGLGWLFR